jgi:hypothetical protein
MLGSVKPTIPQSGNMFMTFVSATLPIGTSNFMADYPNMSYCMCGNTLAAMRQIMQAMEEEGSDSFKELFNMSEDFMARAEELHDEIEYDGQPDEAQEWESFDPDC